MRYKILRLKCTKIDFSCMACWVAYSALPNPIDALKWPSPKGIRKRNRREGREIKKRGRREE